MHGTMGNITNIEASNFTPGVVIDEDNSTMVLSGRSIPHDAYSFYAPIMDKASAIKEVTVTVDLEYMNSRSLRFLPMLMITKLNLSKVIWKYCSNDDDMKEKGELVNEIIKKELPDVDFVLSVK